MTSQQGSPEEIADRVRSAVLAVPGVADMHTGSFGEVATYLPGRKVDGVRVRSDSTEVHVVIDWGVPAGRTADAVRAATANITATRVDVVIQDVAAPVGAGPAPLARRPAVTTSVPPTAPTQAGPGG